MCMLIEDFWILYVEHSASLEEIGKPDKTQYLFSGLDGKASTILSS